jgi:hypothetical protein
MNFDILFLLGTNSHGRRIGHAIDTSFRGEKIQRSRETVGDVIETRVIRSHSQGPLPFFESIDLSLRMVDPYTPGLQRSLPRNYNESKTEDAVTSPIVLCAMCPSPAAIWSVPAASKQNHQSESSSFSKSIYSKNSGNPKEPLCLLHFYTTDACRQEPANKDDVAAVVDSAEFRKQLPKQQEMFAEAFLQVQREIQDAIMNSSTNSFSRANSTSDSDPLSIIVNLSQNSHKKRKNPVSFRRKELRLQPLEGGFLRDIPIPERLLHVQQQQARQQQELIARMNQQSIPTEANLTKRRAPSRTSVWQVLSNDDRKPAALHALSKNIMDSIADDILTDQITCACGNRQVQIVSSNSNRNQDMSKAETWGNKDRHDEIVSRYACARCGKTWNEVG